MTETLFEPLEKDTRVAFTTADGTRPGKVEHDGGGSFVIVLEEGTGSRFAPFRHNVKELPENA